MPIRSVALNIDQPPEQSQPFLDSALVRENPPGRDQGLRVPRIVIGKCVLRPDPPRARLSPKLTKPLSKLRIEFDRSVDCSHLDGSENRIHHRPRIGALQSVVCPEESV